LFEKQTKRGRPKKANPIVENSQEEKQKKTRGRPKKSGKVVDAECNDLIDALMAEAKEETTDAVEEEAKPEFHAPRKALEKKPRKAKLTDEEKEAAKAAKQAEKEAAKQAKLAEKEAVVEEQVEEVTEIYDEVEIKVIEFIYEDEKYLRDNENQVYDYHTNEQIGFWNEETMKIEEFN
jgi:hypothetical protein